MSIQIHFVKLVVFHRVNDKSDLPVALDEKALSSIKLLEFILWESINSHLNIQLNSINKTLRPKAGLTEQERKWNFHPHSQRASELAA